MLCGSLSSCSYCNAPRASLIDDRAQNAIRCAVCRRVLEVRARDLHPVLLRAAHPVGLLHIPSADVDAHCNVAGGFITSMLVDESCTAAIPAITTSARTEPGLLGDLEQHLQPFFEQASHSDAGKAHVRAMCMAYVDLEDAGESLTLSAEVHQLAWTLVGEFLSADSSAKRYQYVKEVVGAAIVIASFMRDDPRPLSEVAAVLGLCEVFASSSPASALLVMASSSSSALSSQSVAEEDSPAAGLAASSSQGELPTSPLSSPPSSQTSLPRSHRYDSFEAWVKKLLNIAHRHGLPSHIKLASGLTSRKHVGVIMNRMAEVIGLDLEQEPGVTMCRVALQMAKDLLHRFPPLERKIYAVAGSCLLVARNAFSAAAAASLPPEQPPILTVSDFVSLTFLNRKQLEEELMQTVLPQIRSLWPRELHEALVDAVTSATTYGVSR